MLTATEPRQAPSGPGRPVAPAGRAFEKCLTDAIDTGTPSGRFFFDVMASLAKMERELTLGR